MRILDATAGSRAVWFDKYYKDAVFIDIRGHERHPGNLFGDCRKTVFPDGSFDLVVFDPPHMTCGPKSQMAQRYGHYLTSEIRDLVRDAFAEFHRVLKVDGLVAFKWNDHDTPLEKVLAPVVGFDRLVGVPTAMRTAHSSVTYWCLLRRVEGNARRKLD
jgi:tRNA G10  N-methylase Trm11